jgi:hypothetical protein
MGPQEEEKKGIKVVISYENKQCVVRIADPTKGIKHTLEQLKKLSRENPDKLWHLPEMDNGGNRIKYYLGRASATGKEEILKELNNNREEQSLFDYNINEGDELILIKRPIAG